MCKTVSTVIWPFVAPVKKNHKIEGGGGGVGLRRKSKDK